MCHGWFQSILAGGPTTSRSSFPQCTSNFRRLFVQISQCLVTNVTKQTTDVIIALNPLRNAIKTNMSQRIHLSDILLHVSKHAVDYEWHGDWLTWKELHDSQGVKDLLQKSEELIMRTSKGSKGSVKGTSKGANRP